MDLPAREWWPLHMALVCTEHWRFSVHPLVTRAKTVGVARVGAWRILTRFTGLDRARPLLRMAFNEDRCWQQLRPLIADGKIAARGLRQEWRGNQWVGATVGEAIPEAEAEHLFLYSHDQDFLGPEPINPNSPNNLWNGIHYWRHVTIMRADLQSYFGRAEPNGGGEIEVGADVAVSAAIEVTRPRISDGATAKDESDCHNWLKNLMTSGARQKSKLEYYQEACSKFPRLGSLTASEPSAPFGRAWKKADKEVQAVGAAAAGQRN
jgi:hypothetical protein